MTRWQPDARGRLALAALELYSERGFDQTTVAEIARRAGLTERTFFRHFADKREVLFAGSELLRERLVHGIEEAPDGLAPIDLVGAALESAAEVFGQRDGATRARLAVVAANPELQERDLIKMAALGVALAAALRARGVAEPAATLAAEAGIAVMKIAYQRWADGTGDASLRQVIRESLAQLKAVATGTDPAARGTR
jgi:AcrR family transcriptional regulator